MSDRPCWLVKSEPDCFSIQDLAKAPKQTTYWDGVRNYQARNFMRDQMRVGDRVLYYHSGAKPPAVAGTAIVVREAYPDHTALDPNSDHYDPAASTENPIWMMVDIKLEKIFEQPIPLDALKGVKGLEKMELLKRGSRLSVQPVTPEEFQVVLDIAEKMAAGPSTAASKSAKMVAVKVPTAKPAKNKKASPKKPATRRSASRAK